MNQCKREGQCYDCICEYQIYENDPDWAGKDLGRIANNIVKTEQAIAKIQHDKSTKIKTSICVAIIIVITGLIFS